MPLRNPHPSSFSTYGPRHLTRESAAVFWAATELESALNSPDIIHSNNFWCPIQVRSSRLIYTFYDMGFVLNPTWTTETNRNGCFSGVFKSAIEADWVIAISEASRAHYLAIFPHFPEDRIRVIYPCSRFDDPSLLGRRPRMLEGITPQNFWLNVGTIEPRKNQHLLIEAYAKYIKLGGKTMPLILAGGKGWLMDDFQRHLKNFGVESQVIMTGYVSDDELIWLYRNCYANVYPSLFEGFGLPILEGMQFGAPTLTSNSSSLPEVAGSAAILLDPHDSDAWAIGMFTLAENRNKRDQLRAASIEQSLKFKWNESALQLMALYEDAVRLPKRNINK
jgi:glycosyltransferase involved in cell wall biosynthesis